MALTGFFVYGGLGLTSTIAAADIPTDTISQAAPTYPIYTVSMTAYNAVPGQTDSNPNITASGAFSNPQIIAARSIDLADKLPFGTIIAIQAATTTPNCGYQYVADKIGLRVIGDSMAARMRNKIDILMDADEYIPAQLGKLRNPAKALGFCRGVQIVVVGHVDIHNIPKTQEELALAMLHTENIATNVPTTTPERLAVNDLSIY